MMVGIHLLAHLLSSLLSSSFKRCDDVCKVIPFVHIVYCLLDGADAVGLEMIVNFVDILGVFIESAVDVVY